MGFRYRKSINLGGGFRVNISKSGVGYSWGTKGYRITKTAKGTTRRTASIPGTGISFVNETGKNKNNSRASNHNQPDLDVENNSYDTEEIKNSVATDIVSDGLDNILSAARKALILDKVATIGIIVSLLASASAPGLTLFLIGFIVMKVYVRSKGKIDLDYEIEDAQKEEVDKQMEPVLKITDCDRLWRIMQSSKVADKKYAAGATNTVKRVACKSSQTSPFPFRTDSTVACFKSKKELLAFFPDKLFIIQGTKIGALNYSDVSMDVHTTRFIESGRIPKDAKVVDRTWKYVNKSGGPDKRFKNNSELPVCLYGEIDLKSSSGLNTIIMFSNANIM